jgi:hypothetical protein
MIAGVFRSQALREHSRMVALLRLYNSSTVAPMGRFTSHSLCWLHGNLWLNSRLGCTNILTRTQINRPLSHPLFPPALEVLSKNLALTRTLLLFSPALYLTSLFC